ncbi:MAG: hypothetical protein ABI237_04560 [Ginsengibacter sp.]
MRINCYIILFLLCTSQPSIGQNTLGLPQIINYSKDDYHGGSHTRGIAQYPSGKMYFPNNETLISFDGNKVLLIK